MRASELAPAAGDSVQGGAHVCQTESTRPSVPVLAPGNGKRALAQLEVVYTYVRSTLGGLKGDGKSERGI